MFAAKYCGNSVGMLDWLHSGAEISRLVPLLGCSAFELKARNAPGQDFEIEEPLLNQYIS